jgi:hypothetical protein
MKSFSSHCSFHGKPEKNSAPLLSVPASLDEGNGSYVPGAAVTWKKSG